MECYCLECPDPDCACALCHYVGDRFRVGSLIKLCGLESAELCSFPEWDDVPQKWELFGIISDISIADDKCAFEIFWADGHQSREFDIQDTDDKWLTVISL